jgi:hypothetical protein
MKTSARLERERNDVDVFAGEETTNPGERAGTVGETEGKLGTYHRRCDWKSYLATPI